MAEVSLLISARDNYSGNLVKMSQANKRFSKDLDGLEAQLDKLTKNKHQIEVETKDAKKELDALKKEYDKAKAAAKGADDTFKDNTGYTKKLAEYQNMCDNLKLVSKEAASAEKAIRNFDDTQSKSNNRAMGAKESLKALSRAGITQMVGTSISGAANAGISSAFGQEQGSMISSALSGTISGAAMGSVAGIPGAAIGGALGLVSGLIEGKTQAFESRDAAFKEYTNDQYVRLADTNKSMLESGVDYASNQEQLKMSFRTMLGSRALADDTMDSMRSMAASTPFGINDLAGGAQTLLSFGVPWHNLMNTVQMLGDVSQGNVSKFDSLALAFGQVSSAGKLSGQDLLQFINAGFNPLNEIVKVTGESMEELRKRMSDGKVSASEVAQAFETATSQGGMFYDALEKQSMTYSGISSTLKDAEAELAAAMGEGYMTMRMPDMQQQIEFYNGETGEAMKEAYQAIGRYKADLENRQYEYQRDAFEALTGGEISELYKNNGNGEFAEQLGGLQASFKEAVENDDGAKLDSLYAEAQAIAEDAYNADTKVQDNLQKQIDLLEQIKDYAALLPDSWESVYRMGQAESRGQLATARGKNEALDVTMTAGESIGDIALKSTSGPLGVGYGLYVRGKELFDAVVDQSNASPKMSDSNRGAGRKHAFGLPRVPFDNYPILAHEGEQLLTAREAREYQSIRNKSETLNPMIRTRRDSEQRPQLGEALGYREIRGREAPVFPAYIPPSAAETGQEKKINITLNVNMSGLTVRDDTDVDKIASALAEKLRIQQMIG